MLISLHFFPIWNAHFVLFPESMGKREREDQETSGEPDRKRRKVFPIITPPERLVQRVRDTLAEMEESAAPVIEHLVPNKVEFDPGAARNLCNSPPLRMRRQTGG